MFRKTAGKVAIVIAGTGCLVLLIFVVPGMMNEPRPSMTQDEIVAEVLGPVDSPGDESGLNEGDGGDEAVMPVPSPLVAVSNDGEELPVIFPEAEPGATAEVEERPADEGAMTAEEGELPQILSAEDVAAAAAALAGMESEPVVPVEPQLPGEDEGVAEARLAEREATAVLAAAEDMEPEVLAAGDREPGEPKKAASSNADVDAVEAVAEVAADLAASGQDAALFAEAKGVERETGDEREEESEAVALAQALAVESVPDVRDGGLEVMERPAVRRGEFDLPASLDSRSLGDGSHPSGSVPELTVAEAARAGDPESGLAPRPLGPGVVVPGTLRGVMGYRLPLVSRQEVPDQIVSGVLIPAHTTFVILKPGSWELVDVSAEELQDLRERAAQREAEATIPVPVEAEKWRPFRIFRKRQAPADD